MKQTTLILLVFAIIGALALFFPSNIGAQDNTLCGYFWDDGYYFYTFYPYNGYMPIASLFAEDNFESSFGFSLSNEIIWLELTNPWFNRAGDLTGFDSFSIVNSCAPFSESTPIVVPILEFYADTDMIYAGECVTLYWNANSVYQQVYLDSTYGPVVSTDGHAPASGSTVVCPLTDTTYRLSGAYDTIQDYHDITIYVIRPTETPLPAAGFVVQGTAVPNTDYGYPLPNDGYEPKPSWFEKLFQLLAPPVEASYSPAECQQRFYEGQCTWFVVGKRPDACEWISPGMGNAYQWIEQAQQNGRNLGISVSDIPHVGDIVVWSANCGGTSPIPQNGVPCSIGDSGFYEGCGHVAFVTWAAADGKSIKIAEMNWSIDRSNEPLEVLSCMSFIGSPDENNASSSTSVPGEIVTPEPVIVPTPTGKPQNIFQWFFELFK